MFEWMFSINTHWQKATLLFPVVIFHTVGTTLNKVEKQKLFLSSSELNIATVYIQHYKEQ